MRKRMLLSKKARAIMAVMVLALLVQFLPFSLADKSTVAGPKSAEAYDFLTTLSNVVPFAGIFNAFRVRNRVYKEANAFIDEEKDYHARLQAKAREMYVNRNLGIGRRSQTGSYMKVSVLIDQERRASLDFAESKKKAAREEFLDQFQKAILTRVINSGAAQELIRAMSAGLRAAQGKLGEALDVIGGGSGGALATLAKINRQASRLQALSGVIGGRGGQRISATMAKITGWYDRVTGTFTVPISQVNEELGKIADQVEGYQTANMLAGGAQTPSDFVIRLVEANSEDPVLDAILGVIDSGSQGNASIREEARQKILIGFVMRCARMGSELHEILSELVAEMDPNYEPRELKQSRCQEVADLLRRAEEGDQSVDEILSTEEETVEEGSGEPLKFLSLETRDGWCFPRSKYAESDHCSYTIDWKLAFSSPTDSAGLRCILYSVDVYSSVSENGQYFQSPAGVWEYSLVYGGFYPEMGEHTEKLVCELYDAPISSGELVSRVEADIVAPLTTIREP